MRILVLNTCGKLITQEVLSQYLNLLRVLITPTEHPARSNETGEMGLQCHREGLFDPLSSHKAVYCVSFSFLNTELEVHEKQQLLPEQTQ